MLTRTLWLSQVMNVVSLFFSASILLVFASSKTLETVWGTLISSVSASSEPRKVPWWTIRTAGKWSYRAGKKTPPSCSWRWWSVLAASGISARPRILVCRTWNNRRFPLTQNTSSSFLLREDWSVWRQQDAPEAGEVLMAEFECRISKVDLNKERKSFINNRDVMKSWEDKNRHDIREGRVQRTDISAAAEGGDSNRVAVKKWKIITESSVWKYLRVVRLKNIFPRKLIRLSGGIIIICRVSSDTPQLWSFLLREIRGELSWRLRPITRQPLYLGGERPEKTGMKAEARITSNIRSEMWRRVSPPYLDNFMFTWETRGQKITSIINFGQWYMESVAHLREFRGWWENLDEERLTMWWTLSGRFLYKQSDKCLLISNDGENGPRVPALASIQRFSTALAVNPETIR